MMARRDETWQLDGGRCVNCGVKLRRNGRPVFEWDSHHCVPAAVLRAHDAPSKYVRTATLCVLLCAPCHSGQTSKMAPVPYERIPLRVRVAAKALGPWAEARLEREHPPVATR